MTNAELLAKIKAEIERRISFHNKGINICTGLNTVSLAHSAGLKEDEELLSFLSTLESEKPINQERLEEELDNWRHEHFHGKRDDHFSGEYLERTSQLDLARHFAQWGAEHLKK